MPSVPPPLSSTVSSVFEAFIKKLGDEKVLEGGALEALKESLMEQKLDPGSLRQAMFTPSDASKANK